MPFPFTLQDEIVRQALLSLAAVVIVLITTRVVLRLVLRYLDDPPRRYRTSKIIRRTGAIVLLVALVLIWSPGQPHLLTILTVIGAGLAIAMREVLLSAVAWLNIILRVPYTNGDRIDVNQVRGDVIDIRLLHTTLMEVGGWVEADQSTGRVVHIPNSWIFQFSVYNYSRGFGFIWNELPVTITFRSDWEAAREIILAMAQESAAVVEQKAAREIRRMSREYLVHYSILTPFVYVRIVPHGVQLTLRYLCEVRKRRGTEHALAISVLDAFRARGDIELAYPMMGIARFDSPQFGPFPNDASVPPDPSDALR
jgi:small-conductance mechanosensitive channel